MVKKTAVMRGRNNSLHIALVVVRGSSGKKIEYLIDYWKYIFSPTQITFFHVQVFLRDWLYKRVFFNYLGKCRCYMEDMVKVRGCRVFKFLYSFKPKQQCDNRHSWLTNNIMVHHIRYFRINKNRFISLHICIISAANTSDRWW